MATARGKIGRIPEGIRRQVNAMIRDNRTAEFIIAFLNGNNIPGVTPQNISAWKEHGYQVWLRRQEKIEDMRSRLEFATNVVREAGKDDMTLASDTAARMAVDTILAVLENFDPSTLTSMLAEKPDKIVGLMCALNEFRKSDQAAVILRQKIEDYERKIKNLTDMVSEKGSASAADIDGIFKRAYGV